MLIPRHTTNPQALLNWDVTQTKGTVWCMHLLVGNRDSTTEARVSPKHSVSSIPPRFLFSGDECL